MKLAYLTLYLSLLFLMLFISRTFILYTNKLIEKGVLIGTLTIVAITLIAPASFSMSSYLSFLSSCLQYYSIVFGLQ